LTDSGIILPLLAEGVSDVAQDTLYKECPLCTQGTVVAAGSGSTYHCTHCGLTLKERSLLGLFKKGNLAVADFGEGDYTLARQSLKDVALPPDVLKITLGNVYTDSQLAAIAGGSLELLRPVRTVLAQVILEQLNEVCYLQVNGLRRGHGKPLVEAGHSQPRQPTPREGMTWQDQGNLFCTNQRLVFPSDSFTFIRMDRKLIGIQAFTDGVALQRKGEDYATYFVGCYPHEAALVAAYVLAKLPALATESPRAEAQG
jgi:ribosomal protein S27AE